MKLSNNTKLLKDKYFWLGFLVFIGTLMPQLLFDFRHQFIMSKAVIKFLSEHGSTSFNPFGRLLGIGEIFYNTFQATLMNNKLLSVGILLISLPLLKRFLIKGQKDITIIVSLVYIFLPFLGYLVLPVGVNPWHLGGPMAASLILIGYLISGVWKINFFGKIISACLIFTLISFSLYNILNYFINDRNIPNMDPSLFKNEIAAIDYVYKYAKGENFKVYTYLPSVYDYPYQYLFWWHGKKTYGYIPKEYVYSPNKPAYIPSQDKFQGDKNNPSRLVFLIKEPDRIKLRQAWENDYKDMKFISKEMVGPIEVEIREEIKTQ